MALTKVSTGMLSADAASVDLNIDANTLFIDASANRVGVANTSPATALDVTGTVTADGLTVANTSVIAGDFDGGTAATYIRLQDDTDNFLFGSNNSLGNFLIKNETADALRLSVANTGDISFYEDTGTTAKFFWDASAESLGIGLSSGISSKLHVNTEISIGADGDNRAIVGYTPNRFYIGTRQSGTNYFDTVSVSGGNLLVGGTSAGEDGAVSISGTGYIQARIDNDTVAYFDRTGSGDDGEVIRIQQNGGTVGSIGTEGGDLVIGSRASGHKGVRFGANYIAPVDTSNSFEDNTTDLGLPAVRFKDLYLSGIIAKGTGGELDLRSDGGGFNYKQNLDVATAGCTLTGQSTRGDMAAIRLYQTATGADGGYIRFDTCNSGSTTLTEKARILSDGSFLIGETSQGLSTRFKIQGPNDASTGFNASFISMGNSGGGYPYIGYNCGPTSTSVTYFRYVNDYASWIDFHAGAVRTFTDAGGTGNTTGTAGPYVSRGGTSWTSSSDRRLKDDIQEISYGLDTVKALEPVSYVMNDRDVESRELGFIAQDVEGVVDEVVSVTDDGYYGLNYQGLIPVLTKAIQEQQATIEALTARIAALES